MPTGVRIPPRASRKIADFSSAIFVDSIVERDSKGMP